MQIECEPRLSDSNPTYYYSLAEFPFKCVECALPLDIGLDSALVQRRKN